MAKGKKKMTTHKNVRQADRPNGKSWKQHPKGFDRIKGRLVPADNQTKGISV